MYLSGNAFALLDEDAPKVSKKAAKAPEPVVAKKEDPKREERKPREGGGRGGKGGERGRGRGGKGKGASADGEKPPRERREFDRHESGDGKVKNATKKGGAGKYNWGAEGEEGAERPPRERRERRPPRDAPTAVAAPAADAPAAEVVVAEVEVAAEVVVEPEVDLGPPVKTLDEFLAERATVEDDLKIKRREVQNDDSGFKAFAAFKPVEEANEYVNAMAKSGSAAGPKSAKTASKKGKVNIDEFMKTNEAAAAGGKGGKGGKGKGGKGGDNRKFTMKDDQFPTLGGKK